MCNPIYLSFQYSLCPWGAAAKSLVFRGTSDITGFRKNYKLFTPRLSPHTPFVLRGFSDSGGPKPLITENDTILNKKKHVLM